MNSPLRMPNADMTTELYVPIGSHLWRVVHTRAGRPFYLLLPDFVGADRIYWPLLNNPSCGAHIAAVSLPPVAEMSVLVNGLAQLVDTLDYQRVGLLGTGFGGKLATHFAAAYPSMVSIVIDIPPGVAAVNSAATEIAPGDARALHDAVVRQRSDEITDSDQRDLFVRSIDAAFSVETEARSTKALLLCNALNAKLPKVGQRIAAHDLTTSFSAYPSLSDPAGLTTVIRQLSAKSA